MFDPQIEADVNEILNEIRDHRIPPFGNILITGANGMLASYIAESFLILKSKNEFQIGNIFLVGRKLSSDLDRLLNASNFGAVFVQLDTLGEFCSENQIDTFIHAASPSSFERATLDFKSLFDTNLKLTDLLLEQIHSASNRFYFFSSGDVYGSSPKFPTGEKDFAACDPTELRNLYGEFKRCAESLMKIYSETVKANYISLRIYHTFGPGVNLEDGRIFSAILKSLKHRTQFLWNSNGTAKRNFLYSKDLFSAILYTSGVSGFNAYNVAGARSISIRDFVSKAAEIGDSELFPEPLPSDPNSVSHIQVGDADTSKLQSMRWSQTVDEKQALIRTLHSLEFRSSYQSKMLGI